MPQVVIELPPHAQQTAFNVRRWAEVLNDPALANLPGRIETDRHGYLIMSPPPAPKHGYFQARIAHLLSNLLPHGRIVTECPISTADGVKAADIAWVSSELWRELAGAACFPRAPEVCIEVISPDNSEAHMEEKMALYFDAGAGEVWLCGPFGALDFFAPGAEKLPHSALCPAFPQEIEPAD